MIDLNDLLNQKTHRNLELLARAHRLPFTRREAKAEGLEQLRSALFDGAYKKAFQTLEPEHLEALQAVIVGGDYLPLPLFEAHFGIIRPYRPWRKHFYPPHPWRYPISVAERLYHLGMIDIIDSEMVTIVAEVKQHLPELIPIEGHPYQAQSSAPTQVDCLRDLSVFLGVLMQAQAKPVHGRWLSLTVMRQINAGLSIAEDLTAIRSELQSEIGRAHV